MSENTLLKKPTYFTAIDGLRLFASINVVLFHLEKMGGFSDLPAKGLFFLIVKGPTFHASAFFILAGFIFTCKYASVASNFNARAFLTSRFKDLYPLHAITTLAMAVLMVVSITVAFPKLLYSCIIHLGLLWSFIPLTTYSLNTPSWALSAFFLCYLLFKPMLNFVTSLKKTSTVFIAILAVFIPGVLWAALYDSGNFSDDRYSFFHIFAPVRLFEFLLGMLCARLFQLRSPLNGRPQTRWYGIVNDISIIAGVYLLYKNLLFSVHPDDFMKWFSYHTYMPAMYAFLLYRLAVGQGYICSFLSIPLIRSVGKSSFYPYILHIPIITWLCFILERYFQYKTFLHSPVNIGIFMVVLYGGSTLWWNMVRVKKRKRYVVETVNLRP